ncbi:MAG: hypothetical protein ACFBSE_07685 [Prochloraceae cyanobacterium]
MPDLTEFQQSILIGIVAGFLSGIFLGILDYIYAKFVQKNQDIELTEVVFKSLFIGLSLAILLGIMVWIEVNFSTSILSISQINKSTIILAIVLPIINFIVDKLLGLLASNKAK